MWWTWPTNGWDRLPSLGHPSKFQWVSRLGFIIAPTSLNESQPNFAWCLAVSWAAAPYTYTYIHFRGHMPPNRILRGAKFTLRPSHAFFHIGTVTVHGTQAAKLCGMVIGMELWNFHIWHQLHGRAAITWASAHFSSILFLNTKFLGNYKF